MKRENFRYLFIYLFYVKREDLELENEVNKLNERERESKNIV